MDIVTILLMFLAPDSRAIRLHMLVNPTGKEHAFRGVDWVVELMNLFTKVVAQHPVHAVCSLCFIRIPMVGRDQTSRPSV